MCITMVSLLAGQMPFLMVHTRKLSPIDGVVTLDVWVVVDVMFTEPEITVHEPVPTDGGFAVKVSVGGRLLEPMLQED